MAKTPQKMVKYLKKIEGLGLRQVRVIVPAEDEGKIVTMADSMRQAYLQKIARNADDADPRLHELANSRLATAVKPEQIAAWRSDLHPSQHIHFDRKVLTMQEEWSKMVVAVQAKNSAQMRNDDAEARRHGASAAVAAMVYRAAKDDLIQYVGTSLAKAVAD